MHQHSNPSHLTWHTDPLPYPGAVHPDSRLIVFQLEDTVPSLHILAPQAEPFNSGRFKERISYCWINEKDGTTWDQRGKEIYWAWFKSWN